MFANRTIVEPSRTIQVRDKVDVLIAGGGPSGTVAALAAARHGAKVLVIERFGFLGGLGTQAPLCTWPLNTSVGEAGNAIYDGIPREIVERLSKIGGCSLREDVWKKQEGAKDAGTEEKTVQNWYLFDPELLKYLLFQIVDENKVDLLLHSLCVGAIVENNCIKGVIIESKGGREAILADVFVDATADGDLSAYAGAQYDIGYRGLGGLTMPPETSWIIAGVDTDNVDPAKINEVYAEAKRTGEIVTWRKNILVNAPFLQKGLVKIFGTRILGVNMLDPASLTYAEKEQRHQMHQITNLLKKEFSAFKDARIVCSQVYVPNRGVRRIIGLKTLTEEDILKGKKYPDQVAVASNARIEIHPPNSEKITFVRSENPKDYYHIQFGCLVPSSVDNLITTGGCISSDMIACGAVNTMPNAMLLGQASGTAAALCVNTNVKPKELNVKELQNRLKEDGMFLD